MASMGPERRAEDAFRIHVHESGGICIKLGGTRGIPDRLVLGPHGVHYFAEFKSLTGRLSRAQKWWRDLLHRLGHICKRHTNAPEAIAFYEQEVEAASLSTEGSESSSA